MSGRTVRAAIVGASSLLGKELAEELNRASSLAWDITLLETSEEAAGQITSAGDEAMLVQAVGPGSFIGLDFAFFATDAPTTRLHWKTAVDSGASVVDLSGGLVGESGMSICSPWTRQEGHTHSLDIATIGAVSAHPAAIMLGLVLARLRQRFNEVRIAATVMEPASQQGSAGLDEMHGQTVGLLSFQTLPKDVYDEQVAFNLNAVLGSAAQVDLAGVTRAVREHLLALTGKQAAQHCALQLVQAPVFNAYTASVFVELDGSAEADEIARALDGGVVSVAGPDDDAPSNRSATEQGQVLVSVRAEPNSTGEDSGFWLWMAADNLRLAARNAAACATELLALRPGARVQ